MAFVHVDDERVLDHCEDDNLRLDVVNLLQANDLEGGGNGTTIVTARNKQAVCLPQHVSTSQGVPGPNRTLGGASTNGGSATGMMVSRISTVVNMRVAGD